MKKGSVLVGVIILLTGLMTMSVVLSSAVLSSSIKIQKQYKKLSALAYAEAGVNKGLWQINRSNLSYGTAAGGVLETDLSGGEYRVWVTDCPAPATDCKFIKSTGYIPTEAKPDATRTVRVKINGVQTITNVNFANSAQSNAHKIQIGNGATVKGSAYSEGPITMGNGSKITGNATSAGLTPTASSITLDSGSGATINGTAKAFTIGSKITAGLKTTGEYPLSQSMPIPEDELESTITDWETAAAAGYNSPGSLTLTGTNNQLGPAKINGDLTINGDLKVTGAIWVDGNITITGGSHVYLDSSFGNNSGIIIADYRADRTSKGKITIGNGAVISGIQRDNPKTTSYLLMFSTKTSTETNWNTDSGYAIELAYPGILGGVYYAPFGSFHQKNNGQVRAVAANGIILDNNAVLDYDGNWGNSGISTGPGGKWTITEWLILN